MPAVSMSRSRAAMESSMLLMVVCDQSAPFTQEDADLLKQAMELSPTILVWNKSDLPSASIPVMNLPESLPVVELSAKEGAGLDGLEAAVAQLFPRDSAVPYGELLSNQRQEEAARRAWDSVRRAREALEFGVTPDALLTDVEEALAALGELSGQSVREDITDRIFQRFCVGK